MDKSYSELRKLKSWSDIKARFYMDENDPWENACRIYHSSYKGQDHFPGYLIVNKKILKDFFGKEVIVCHYQNASGSPDRVMFRVILPPKKKVTPDYIIANGQTIYDEWLEPINHLEEDLFEI